MRIQVFGFIGERTKRQARKMDLPRREYFLFLRYVDVRTPRGWASRKNGALPRGVLEERVRGPVPRRLQEFPGLKDRWNGTTHFKIDNSDNLEGDWGGWSE